MSLQPRGKGTTEPYLSSEGCDLFPDKLYCYEEQVRLQVSYLSLNGCDS